MTGSTLTRRVARLEERLGSATADPLGELARIGAAGQPADAELIFHAMVALWGAASADASGEQEAYREAVAKRGGMLSPEARRAIDEGEWRAGCDLFLAAMEERRRHGLALAGAG